MRNDFSDCLLVCDIDGTLAEGQVIHPDNIRALERFRSMSGQVVLATGRTPQSAAPLVRRLSANKLLICNNGAVLYDCHNNSVAWERTLKLGSIVDDIRAAFSGMGILSYWQDKLTMYQSSPAVERLIVDEKLQLTDEDTPTPNKLLLGDEPHKLAQAEDFLRRLLDPNEIDIVRASPHFTELLPKNADKAGAVKRVAEILGIKRDNLFVAGNYFNDISMMKLARVSCAPCDSPDEVKNCADYVARACKDGAVADFIEHLINMF